MKKKLTPILILLFVGFLLLAGCGLSPKGTFLASQQTFNDMVKAYHVYYKNAPAGEQAELKADVHPKVIEALGILTQLNEAIRLGIEPSQIDKDKFRELRYGLYERLPKIFGKEDL